MGISRFCNWSAPAAAAPNRCIRGGAIAAALAALTLVGCATPTQPADRICVVVKRMPQHEEAYLLRKAASYLKQYGFTAVTDNCEASVDYERFASTQGATVTPGWSGSVVSSTWNQEGIAKLSYGKQVVFEDWRVDLQGYSTNQALLDALAWAIVQPITRHYKSTLPQ